MEQEVKPQFAQFNSKILAFKYPSSFDEKTCRKIIELFKQQVNQGNLYLSFEDVKKLYENLKDQDEKKRELEFKTYIHTSNWLKKNPDDLDMDKQAESESDRLLRENLKIMLYDDVIKSVVIIYHSDSTLKEIKKHFLVQINRDLLTQAKELSRKAILHFIRDRLQHSEYPYDTVTEEANIFHSLPDHFFDANSILYSLISENNVVKVPLLKEKDGSQVYSDFLIPGRLFETEVNQFMDTELIPSLAKRYKELSPLISTIMKMHKTHIPVEDIIPEKRETVCRYCFIILEARRQSKDFPMEYFNLAQLTLNCWLAMEHDPLMALRAFPSVELDNDFISPFLSRYIQEFSHIAEYLKTIKEFIEHLPQVIEEEELINFFKIRGIQRKVVETFLNHRPVDIMVLLTRKANFVIAKSQIIKAIHYLFEGNYHKKSDSAMIQFEILAQAFGFVEESSQSHNQVLLELKATSEQYKATQDMLLDSEFYQRMKHKAKDKSSLDQNISDKSHDDKKVYTEDDFANIDGKDREALFKALKLMEISCVDNHKQPYILYIKKSALTMDDARFLRGKPTYELICKRFSL